MTQPELPGPSSAEARAQRRAHRAGVARSLHARAPVDASGVTWQALEHAPAWLALDDAALRMLKRRVGSVLLAPTLRLWISAAKVQAARAALGDAWWTRLVSHQAWPAWSADAGDWPVAATPKTPEAVAEILEEAGGAVLVATLPHGALRHAASLALAPIADVALLPIQAQVVFSITRRWLEAEAESVLSAHEAVGGAA